MDLENKQYLDWTGVQALWTKIKKTFATQTSLNDHITDAVKHITADERTKWNKVDGKADKATTLAGYNIGDAYTKQEVDDAITNKVSALGAVFIFKGQVADMTALKAIVDPKPGDVYHVVTGEKGTHAEYVWVAAQTGGEEAHWEELGTTVDLSGYLTTKVAESTYATKDAVNTLDGAAEKLGNKVDDITKVADEDVTTKYPSVKAVKEAIKNLPAVDEKVKQTAITTGESFILIAGATTSGQSAEANYNDNVKINAATGTLTATAFKGDLTGNVTGNLTGNADSATKATQDGAGAVIADTYAKKTDLVTAIDASELKAWLDDPKNN